MACAHAVSSKLSTYTQRTVLCDELLELVNLLVGAGEVLLVGGGLCFGAATQIGLLGGLCPDALQIGNVQILQR